MKHCRVCLTVLAAPVFKAPSPAITSVLTFLDVATEVYVCEGCGHAQCPDLPDIQAFYDTEYRISLESEDHDQIFAVTPSGDPIYRTDHQTFLSLRLLDLPPNAKVLDYGAAKAATLRKLTEVRADVVPHVFDVSNDYERAWGGWVPRENQATHSVPDTWHGKFDAVMSHFVIEHVADPVAFLKNIRALLKSEGRLLLSLPNVADNPGDMAVVDHLNHFSEVSLRHALGEAGFTALTLDTVSFPGAIFAVATSAADNDGECPDPTAVAKAAAINASICEFWREAGKRLDVAAERYAGQRCAIYGAGFYGSWIHGRLKDKLDIAAFLDQNPKLQGASHLGPSVISPSELPENVHVVFMGLNPLKARAIAAQVPVLARDGLELVWLDD
ncbi:MAG TPA: hypothetical protein DIC56_08540 [Rhizobium sp.]|nr:hypothetical protein [Rhizobium sp.]